MQQVAKVGTPDILMCLCGIFVAIELKSEDGKISALQEYNLDKIARCGGLAIIITPQNVEESILFLEHIVQESSKYVSKGSVFQ